MLLLSSVKTIAATGVGMTRDIWFGGLNDHRPPVRGNLRHIPQPVTSSAPVGQVVQCRLCNIVGALWNAYQPAHLPVLGKLTGYVRRGATILTGYTHLPCTRASRGRQVAGRQAKNMVRRVWTT
jgi:hypothetical protein